MDYELVGKSVVLVGYFVVLYIGLVIGTIFLDIFFFLWKQYKTYHDLGCYDQDTAYHQKYSQMVSDNWWQKRGSVVLYGWLIILVIAGVILGAALSLPIDTETELITHVWRY